MGGWLGIVPSWASAAAPTFMYLPGTAVVIADPHRTVQHREAVWKQFPRNRYKTNVYHSWGSSSASEYWVLRSLCSVGRRTLIIASRLWVFPWIIILPIFLAVCMHHIPDTLFVFLPWYALPPPCEDRHDVNVGSYRQPPGF